MTTSHTWSHVSVFAKPRRFSENEASQNTEPRAILADTVELFELEKINIIGDQQFVLGSYSVPKTLLYMTTMCLCVINTGILKWNCTWARAWKHMSDKTKPSGQSQVVSSVLERVSSGESEGCDEQRGFRGTLCACSHWPIQVILYISMIVPQWGQETAVFV